MAKIEVRLWSHRARAEVVEFGKFPPIWGVAPTVFSKTWDVIHIPAEFIAGPPFATKARAERAAREMYRVGGRLTSTNKAAVIAAFPKGMYQYLKACGEVPEGWELSHRSWIEQGCPSWRGVRRSMAKGRHSK